MGEGISRIWKILSHGFGKKCVARIWKIYARSNTKDASNGFGKTLIVLMKPVFTEETEGMHITDMERC